MAWSLKKSSKILLISLGAIVIALLVIPQFIGWNSYRPLIAEEVTKALGRSIAIKGDIKLSLLPNPTVQINQVELTNIPGGKSAYMAQVARLDAKISLFSLLRGRINVKGFEIYKPEVILEILPNGTKNWEFPLLASKNSPGESSPSKLQSVPTSPAGSSIQISQVKILKGLVLLRNLKTQSEEKVEDFNLNLNSDSVQGSFQAEGSLILQQMPLKFETTIGSLEQSSTPIKTRINAGENNLTFEGSFTLADLKVAGELEATMSTLTSLLGEKTKAHPLLQKAIHLKTHVQCTPSELNLNPYVLEVGALKFQGQLASNLEQGMWDFKLAGPGQSHLAVQGKGDLQVNGLNIQFSSEQFQEVSKALSVELPTPIHQVKAAAKLLLPGKAYEVQNLDLKVDGASLKGMGRLQGTTVAFDFNSPEVTSWLKLLNPIDQPKLGPLKATGHLALPDKTAVSGPQDIDVSVQFGGGHAHMKGRLLPKGVNLTVVASHPQADNLIAAFGGSGIHLGSMQASAHVKQQDNVIIIEGLKGELKPKGFPTAFAGNLQVTMTQKGPKAKVDLAIKKLNVEAFLSASSAQSRHALMGSASLQSFLENNLRAGEFQLASTKPTGKVVPPSSRISQVSGSPWPREPLNLGWMQDLDADIHLTVAEAIYGKWDATNLVLKGGIHNEVLSFPTISGNLLGGSLNSTCNLSAKNTPEIALTLEAHNVNLGKALKQGAELEMVQGTLDFSLNAKGRGASLEDVANNLSGHSSFQVKKGIVQGFDLKALSTKLGNLNSLNGFIDLLSGFMTKGNTPFQECAGTFDIQKGVATTNDLRLRAEGGEGNAQGRIRLAAWTLDLDSEFKLTEHPKLPSFRMHLSGPIDQPTRQIDTSQLQQYLMQHGVNTLLDQLVGGRKGDNKSSNPLDILQQVVPQVGLKKQNKSHQGNEEAQSSQEPERKSPPKPEDVVKGLMNQLLR